MISSYKLSSSMGVLSMLIAQPIRQQKTNTEATVSVQNLGFDWYRTET